jgi:inner membrane protein
VASAFAHAACGAALWPLFRSERAPKKAWLTGTALAVLPDIDVVGLRFGIPYGDLLGHRGLTHSLLFALVCGSVVALTYARARDDAAPPATFVAYCVVAVASHGLLDALTTGGLGVALWAPLDGTRYFLPWRPIAVSPIGIRPFFASRGVTVLVNEAGWVGVPSLIIAAAGRYFRRTEQERAATNMWY